MTGRSVLDWPTGLTVYKPEKCWNGYTLFHASPYTYMIDMKGEVVHMWCGGSSSFKYQKNQKLLTTLVDHANFQERVAVEFTWESDVAWKYKIEEGTEMHHDLTKSENGNIFMLLRKWTEAPKGWRNYKPAQKLWYVLPIPKDLDKPVLDDFYREVNPEGEIVWEWHSVDHFDDFEWGDKVKEMLTDRAGDWLHTNTLEVLPDGNILTCFRHVNMIAIIDKKTGKFIWRWGTGPDELVGPHHPNMIPKGMPSEGNIIIYDNGGSGGYPPRQRNYTRLVEVNPKTDEIVWEYVNLPKNWVRTHYSLGTMIHHMRRFFSHAWGSVQRLPNGNTLSLDAAAGRLFEVTYDGEIVWEYVNPFLSSGDIQPAAKLKISPSAMPSVNFYLSSNPQPAVRMTSMSSLIYRCYRIAYENAPKATHG